MDREARYHRAQVSANLAIGGETPPQIKRIDRESERGRAGFALRLFEAVFVVPPFPDKQRVAYVATELVDAVFTASILEAGRLTPTCAKLTKLAAIGFLSKYFGATLAVRSGAN